MLKLTLCYFYYYYTKTNTLLDIQLEYCTGFFTFLLSFINAYLMKVIPKMRNAHQIWYLRFYLNNCETF